MTTSERIDTLVRLLEGDNARAFSQKTGIPASSLSRIRNGQGKPTAYFDRILLAYPNVRKKWLYLGEGEPLKDRIKKEEITRRLERIEAEVKRLADLMAELLSSKSSSISLN